MRFMGIENVASGLKLKLKLVKLDPGNMTTSSAWRGNGLFSRPIYVMWPREH